MTATLHGRLGLRLTLTLCAFAFQYRFRGRLFDDVDRAPNLIAHRGTLENSAQSLGSIHSIISWCHHFLSLRANDAADFVPGR
jgi:hypothetical protein